MSANKIGGPEIERLVQLLGRLPGLGHRSARKAALALLKRRAQWLYQKIARRDREETRLDDYVLEFRQWLTEKFKPPRKKWQDPQVLVRDVKYSHYFNFELNFFVDDVKLENGRRGDRISSQIHQEITRYLKGINCLPG